MQTPDDGGARVAPRADTSNARAADTSVPKPSAAARGLPCNVQEIVDGHCALCHGAEPMFGAPIALATAKNFQAASKDGRKIYEVARERVNEADVRKQMPPASARQLDEDARATLNAWLSAGAKESSETCASGASDAGASSNADSESPKSTEGLECYRFTAHNGDGQTPYKVGVAADSYIGFTFVAPWQGKESYAVVLKPIIDNTKALHHMLFYQDNAPGTASGPVGVVGSHPTGEFVHGWAPGGGALDLRDRGADLALELSSDSTYSIEAHYNSNDPNAVDASGIEVCIMHRKPENIAAISWLGYDQLLLPATTWQGTCAPSGGQSVRILGVTPHMHLQGRHMKSTIHRADGTTTLLHDGPFDFQYQRSYDKDIMVYPGDTITTECTYAQPMAWGEGTNDEMCVLFTYAYPKGVLVDNGPWASLAHGNNSCMGQ